MVSLVVDVEDLAEGLVPFGDHLHRMVPCGRRNLGYAFLLCAFHVVRIFLPSFILDALYEFHNDTGAQRAVAQGFDSMVSVVMFRPRGDHGQGDKLPQKKRVRILLIIQDRRTVRQCPNRKLADAPRRPRLAAW